MSARKPSRKQIILTPQLALTAGQAWWQNTGNTGGAIAANPAFHHLLAKRVAGSVFSSDLTNTLEIQFSPDGVNWQNTQPLVADTNNPNSFPFDYSIACYPFFRFVVTDGGAGSTVQVQATVFEEGSGASVSGVAPPPTPSDSSSTLTVLGFGQTTTLDNATAQSLATIFGAPVPAGATTILVQVGTGVGGDTSVPCNWRADGTAPTPTAGQTLLVGQGLTLALVPASLANFEIIGSSAGPSTCRVTFFK